MLFLILSFVAPFLCHFLYPFFDENADISAEVINYSSAPLLAIAGILMSFLAFYIQYRANKEQKEQIVKLSEEKKNEVIRQYKSVLSLFAMDLKAFCDNIEQWKACLKTYKLQLEDNPGKSVSNNPVQSKFLGRYKSIDRNQLKFAFDHFNINDDSLSHPAQFETVYDNVESCYEFIEGEMDKFRQGLEIVAIQYDKLQTAFKNIVYAWHCRPTFMDEVGDYVSITNYTSMSFDVLKKCRNWIDRYNIIGSTEEDCSIINFANEYDVFEKVLDEKITQINDDIEFFEGQRDYFNTMMLIIKKKLEYGSQWPNK